MGGLDAEGKMGMPVLPVGDCWMMDPTPLQNSSNVRVPSPSGSSERSASAKSWILINNKNKKNRINHGGINY